MTTASGQRRTSSYWIEPCQKSRPAELTVRCRMVPVRTSQSCSAAAATPQDWLQVASLTEGALSPIG